MKRRELQTQEYQLEEKCDQTIRLLAKLLYNGVLDVREGVEATEKQGRFVADLAFFKLRALVDVLIVLRLYSINQVGSSEYKSWRQSIGAAQIL